MQADDVTDEVLQQISSALASPTDRTEKAWRIAQAVRLGGNYRRVGLYEVDAREIAILAWSGPGPPAHPRFPVTQGLSGHAVATRATVVCNDVARDPRYLIAFGSTQSEIIVPIIAPETRTVIGTLDVESERAGVFTEADRERLERYARALAALWR